MGDIVNLSRYRKARERARGARRGAENRARTGQSRSARLNARHDARRRNAELDGKRLERDSSGEPEGG